MGRTKKFICAVAALALAVSLSTMGVMAISHSSVSYDTTTSEYCTRVVNDTGSAQTLSVNTRPTTSVDAVVELRASDGAFLQSAIFPWQVARADWQVSIPGGTIRRLYVRPAVNGQRVAGTLYYK